MHACALVQHLPNQANLLPLGGINQYLSTQIRGNVGHWAEFHKMRFGSNVTHILNNNHPKSDLIYSPIEYICLK